MAKILIVDDEESIRFSFKKILTDVGHHVETASHSIDAKSIITASKYDIVVVDRIMNDGIDGLDLIKFIYETQTDCAKIMMTAYPTIKSKLSAEKFKTFAYLVKPVKKNILLSAIAEAERGPVVKMHVM